MKHPCWLLACTLTAILPCAAQVNITGLGHLDYQEWRNSDLSNLWGYADEEGNEYALVGVNGMPGAPNSGGVSVVDVTDPAHPVEVFFAASVPNEWREIKVWDDHAYVTTEGDAGLLIIDLRPLPQSTDLPTTVFIGNGWVTSHSLFIDEHGRLYIHGANRGNRGVIMYDLTQDPEAPVEVGLFDNWYCHDSYARGDTLYAAHVIDGFFSIVDVHDPAHPELLGTRTTPSHFTHNCWLDDTGRFLFTTDERSNAYVAAYDVSDPTDINEVCRLQSDAGSNTIPHNTYWLNGYLVTSYYTYGVTIYDAADPAHLVETGSFDTSPASGDGFNGAWGVYPFLPSGNLLVSDIQTGLHILAPTYVRAARIHGVVTDEGTGVPITEASITIAPGPIMVSSGADGTYQAGTVATGPLTISFAAPGYVPQDVEGVALTNGSTTELDVQLRPIGMAVEERAVGTVQALAMPDGGWELRAPGLAQGWVRVLDQAGRSLAPAARVIEGRARSTDRLASGLYVLHVMGSDGGRIATARLVMP